MRYFHKATLKCNLSFLSSRMLVGRLKDFYTGVRNTFLKIWKICDMPM